MFCGHFLTLTASYVRLIAGGTIWCKCYGVVARVYCVWWHHKHRCIQICHLFPLPPSPSMPPAPPPPRTQALLGTIAAMYAVAASWTPPPPPLPAAVDKSSPLAVNGDGRDFGLNAGGAEGQGKPGQWGQTTSREGAVEVGPEQCTERQSRGYRSARPEPRTLNDHGDRHGTRATPPLDSRRDSNQPPSIGKNDVHKSQQALHHGATTTLHPVSFVPTREGNSRSSVDDMLRKRAERAERLLEVTRERLRRALEDGAANAAAAVTEANLTTDGEGAGGGGGGGKDGRFAAAWMENGGEEAKRSDDGVRRVRRRRGRGAAPEGSASPLTLRSTPTSRGRSSSSGETEEVEERTRQEDVRGGRRAEEPWSSGFSWRDRGHKKKYYSSDGATAASAEQRRRRRQLGGATDPEERRGERRGNHSQRRRRHSSMSVRRAAPVLHEDDDGGFDEPGTRRGRGSGDGEDEMRGSNTTRSLRPGRRRRRRVVELRASDLARMREVVARLRIATFQLEAERAGRLDSTLPVTVEEGARAFPPSAVAEGARGVAGEAEADALVRENASLRRKLRGLVALEELEGRAIKKGLLPLTGGGEPGAEFFPRDADASGDQHS